MYRLFVLCFAIFSLINPNNCQEANFGKKVKCFIMQGSVVCPECNSRGGLLCPSRPEGKSEFESCETSTEEPSTVTEELTEINNDTTTVTLPYDYDKMETSFIKNSDVMLYLYHYFGPIRRRGPEHSIKSRSVDNEASLETCRWNGDCPCPLICCKRGTGCPKKCVLGIRLPPHIRPHGK